MLAFLNIVVKYHKLTYNLSMFTKTVKFDGQFLWLKDHSKEQKLGEITTRKGQLTRAQKLKAVANTGQWVKV